MVLAGCGVKGLGPGGRLGAGGLAAVLGLVVVLVGVVPAHSGSAWEVAVEPADLSLEQVLERLHRRHTLTEGAVRFRQEIVAQGWLAQWTFHTEVVRREDTMEIVIYDGPWFLPDEAASALVELEDVLMDFTLTLTGMVREAGRVLYVVAGERSPDAGRTGAIGGEFWVEDRTGLIDRVQIRYWWGTLQMMFQYEDYGSRVIVTEQTALLRPYGLHLHVVYRDYEFDFADTRQE